MSEKKHDTKKTTNENAAPGKKVTVKKAPVKKASTSKKKVASRTTVQTKSTDSNISSTMQAVIQEMIQDRESRDKQISTLIQEVHQGFSTLSNRSSELEVEHEKEMTGLHHSLQNVFGKLKDSNEKREDSNLSVLKNLSDTIMKDHEKTLKETLEQEKLQDKKIQYMDKLLEQRTGRNRLIAIPGVIIALTGVVYMFYVVNIMESAMTNMSQDMHLIQLSVGNMSEKVGSISQDTTVMNRNMEQLSNNTGQMSNDLNVLTRNVAPAMKGMRDIMPWSP